MKYIFKNLHTLLIRATVILAVFCMIDTHRSTASAQDVTGLLTPEDGAYIYNNYQASVGHGFNVYRITDGTEEKLNDQPIYPASNGAEFQNMLGDLYDQDFEEQLEVSSPHEAFLSLRGDRNMKLILSFAYPEMAIAFGNLYIDESPVTGRQVTYRMEWVDRIGNPTGVEAEQEMILQEHDHPAAENIEATREGEQVTIDWSYPRQNIDEVDYVIRFDLFVRPGNEEYFRKVNDRSILRQTTVTDYQYRFELNPAHESAEIVVEAIDYTGKVRRSNTAVEVEIADKRQPSAILEVYSNRTAENFIDITWPVSTETFVAGYHIERINQETEERERITEELIDLRSPSYRDTTAEEGFTYYYYIKAVSMTGVESEEGNPAIQQIPSIEPPPSPDDLRAELTEDGRVELLWDGNQQNEHFNTFVILRRVLGDGRPQSFSQVNSERVVNEYLMDDGIAGEGFTEGLFYEYGVAAADRHGLRSDTVFAVLQFPNVTPPEPPVSFESDIDRGVRLNLRWGASPSTDVTSYNVYKMSETADTTVKNVPRNRRFLADDNVRPGSEYQYFVTAVDSSGNESDPSRMINLVMRENSPPASVRNLQAVDTEDGIHLRWQPSTSDDVTGYLVQRSSLSNGIYDTLTDDPVEGVNWIDQDGEPGTWYRIIAVDQSGNQSRPGNPRQAVIRN